MPTNTYVAIDTRTLTSATNTVTFTSIPQTYTDLVLVVTPASSVANLQASIRFNNDTAGNYSATEMAGNGSSATSFRYTSQPQMSLSPSVALHTTLGQGQYIISIMNYTNTTTFKTVLCRTGALGSTFPGTAATVGLWRKTPEAINRIDVLDVAGNFVIGSTFTLYGIRAEGVSPAVKATGGVITSDSTYYYHVFAATGVFTPLSSLTADVLVVAGGGGGSYGQFNTSGFGGGGGGAGGYRTATGQSLTATNYNVTVGGGGAGGTSGTDTGTSGSNSVFNTITSAGGGGGSNQSRGALSGGSGGGSGTQGNIGSGNTPSTTPSQGNNGGASPNTPSSTGGGGGGGAGAVGATSTGPGAAGGIGSNSVSSWMTALNFGVNGYLAGGGGGGAGNGITIAGAGGLGGGGNGGASAAGSPGLANTGGGGGGAGGANNGGAGGSGIVIVRYLKA